MYKLILCSVLFAAVVVCQAAPQEYRRPYRQEEPRPVRRQYAEPQSRDVEPDVAPSEPYQSYDEPSYAPSSYKSNPEHDRYAQSVQSEASSYSKQLEPGYSGDDGDRLTFQIHGQEGPHSYKFGYDTGKGYDRQFRYEERDGYGFVRGRYGFYDKYGKMQVVNYYADPYKGFHAEGDFGKFPHDKH